MFNFFKSVKTQEEEIQVLKVEEFENIQIIAEYFHKETGITFENQMSVLKSKVMSFCRQRNIFSFSQLLNDVKSQERLKQQLINYLTTNETFFYREFKQIEKLVQLVKHSHGSVKILCAPSATGEEPYSIAIALLEAGVSPNFKITGIDINADAISKATKAVYTERNLRNLSSQIVSKYFKKDENSFILQESVKSLVSFKLANIFEDSFSKLGKFDFVFSRNMLIYFDKETKLKAKLILEKMRKSEEQGVFFGHADLF